MGLELQRFTPPHLPSLRNHHVVYNRSWRKQQLFESRLVRLKTLPLCNRNQHRLFFSMPSHNLRTLPQARIQEFTESRLRFLQLPRHGNLRLVSILVSVVPPVHLIQYSSLSHKLKPVTDSKPDLKPIRRALLSVTDKTGLIDFARALASHNVELVSTGGTSKALREAGLTVRDISDLTGFPEMLDGRVKTLHPKVHGGILHIRDNAEHIASIEAHHIQPIDMVVVNLYPFEKTAQKPNVAFHEIIENIDIGGPSMVRSAAKNFTDVAIVTSTADYPLLAEELAANSGSLTQATRWRLAKQAFATTAAYDSGIATALESIAEPSGPAVFSDELPQTVRITDPISKTLRYGENPHQRAALYTDGSGKGIASAVQLQGKELSYNNIVDLDACWELVTEFDRNPQ